jgi:inhibitor of cysteine peptidase
MVTVRTMPEGEVYHDVKLRHGEKFKIELKSEPSTGYRWHLLLFDQNALNLLSSEYVSLFANQIVGVGVEHFSFEATTKGKTKVKMVYKRSWEKDQIKFNEFLIDVL